MSRDCISEADARELLRVMHEDQGLRQPGFSREFALRIITTLSEWFDYERSYYSTIWIERWEPAKPVEEPPAPKPIPEDFDEIPF